MFINPHNCCFFAGRIISDPEFTQMNGQNGPFLKAKFRMAVDRNLTSQQRQASMNGDKSIVTSDFINCIAIGQNADFIQKYCPKGRAIDIACHFTTYEFTDKQTGQKVYGNQFDIDSIKFSIKDAKNMVDPNNNNQQQQNNNNYNNGGNNYQNNNGYQNNNNGNMNNGNMNGGNQGNFEMFDDNNSPF